MFKYGHISIHYVCIISTSMGVCYENRIEGIQKWEIDVCATHRGLLC